MVLHFLLDICTVLASYVNRCLLINEAGLEIKKAPHYCLYLISVHVTKYLFHPRYIMRIFGLIFTDFSDTIHKYENAP